MSYWIASAIKKKGSLRKAHGLKKGQKLTKNMIESDEKKGGAIGKRAQLAETLAKFRKKK